MGISPQPDYDTRNDSSAWITELKIRFQDGKEEHFFIELTKTGTYVVPEGDDSCDWTRLDFHKCPCCPLDSLKTEFCPAAESLEATLHKLNGHYSYEKVSAEIIDANNRVTSVKWQLQEVGSTFVQLAVFSSPCPVGRQFKPLIKDLRPFSTNDELSKHLIGKFLLKHRGKKEECEQEIQRIMDPLRMVFSHLAKRISGNSSGDAMANSIVRLDAFALNVSLHTEEVFKELSEDLGWHFPPFELSTKTDFPETEIPSSDEQIQPESTGSQEDSIKKRTKLGGFFSKIFTDMKGSGK